MKKMVELPLMEPKISTYHGQAALCGMLVQNPSIWNWLLNEAVILTCERDFLFGFSSPQLGINKTDPTECPHINKEIFHMQFTQGYTNYIIRALLDNGYYAFFDGIDDYYMDGKSWYKERHFSHNGLICGYDMEEKTYTVFAYDKNWILRKFKVPIKCFNAGRKAMFKKEKYGVILGLSPNKKRIEFSPETVYEKLTDYLDSNLEKYPPNEKGRVSGIAVHDYLVKFLDMHIDGSIPYEKLDRRVFRLIWEHKNVMLERLVKMEEVLSLDFETSKAYKNIVAEADAMRMLYASHHMKQRDSLLPVIKRKLIEVKDEEHKLLTSFLKKSRKKSDGNI